MNLEKLNIYLVILTIISLFLLFIFSFFFKPPVVSIDKDFEKHLDKVVLVSGTIKEVSLKENNLFFQICKYSRCVKVVYFNASKNEIDVLNKASLRKQEVKIIGKVTLYNDQPEIILYKFEVV